MTAPISKKTAQQPLAALFNTRKVDGMSGDSYYHQVLQRLRLALMEGYFSPGQRIPIRSIAEAAGTSTMPVRTAISRLVATGALIQLPNRRISVPLMTSDEYRELTAAKILIETSLVEANFPLITNATIEQLKTLHGQMCYITTLPYAIDNIRRYLRLNKAFHFTVYRLCNSETLMEIIESLWLRTGPYFNFLHEQSSTWNGNETHAAILHAAQHGSAIELKKAFEEDLRGANEFIAELLQKRR